MGLLESIDRAAGRVYVSAARGGSGNFRVDGDGGGSVDALMNDLF